jgi:YgiT-type zinc finger domain-containing protein
VGTQFKNKEETIKMAKCHFCGGEITKGKKTFTLTREDYCVIIRDIPTDICSQCGEAYYDPEQGRTIEKILKTLNDHVKKLQIPTP